MKILVSGASGLVGTKLLGQLSAEGHAVARLVRGGADRAAGRIGWDPAAGAIDLDALEGFDAVVHLAGEPIADRFWTKAQKARIRASRVDGTQLLARALATRAHRPWTLIAASAIGYYGDRGDAELDETSPPGSGFLADVCRQWEAATAPAAEAGIRVVNVRIGIVLSSHGGLLARLLTPFRLGLGGPLGSGRQYLSWITLEDLAAAIRHVLGNAEIRGPVNAVAPHPVTNRAFTQALGHVLHRPTILAAPAFALRLALGEMADELMLASERVLPRRLLETRFEFQDPELERALQRLVGIR